MISEITVFYGSKKDYEALLEERVPEDEKSILFMELIQHYNARLRPNESGVRESALARSIEVDNCIVRSEDYGSVLEHVLSNFVSLINLNYNINHLYVHNPPKRVMDSLDSFYDDIEFEYSNYCPLNRDKLSEVYELLNKDVLGQEDCKDKLITGLYKIISMDSDKPIVLMLYGPSGVGKTETAKSISNALGGKLLRIQFSMMQSAEAYNYIFGAEHSKSSFARDMMNRETNIILIDEFDKVNPIFYNAFYELFDEGRYVDSNYEVDLTNAVFLCTSNFMSEYQIKEALGPAMFSRIGECIEYAELSKKDKDIIIEKWYKIVVDKLKDDEKILIEKSNILDWFKSNSLRYDNIRILKTKLENAIFELLTHKFIIDK